MRQSLKFRFCVVAGLFWAAAPAAAADAPRIDATLSAEASVRTLTIVIDNMDGGRAVQDLRLSEALDNGLVVASPANATTTCAGGIIVALPGSQTIDYEGGSVAANTACTVWVDVTVPDAAPVPTEEDVAASAPVSAASSGPLVLGAASSAASSADAVNNGAGDDYLETRREDMAARDADLSSRRNNRLANDDKPLRIRSSRTGEQRALTVATSLRRIIGGGALAVSHSLTQETEPGRGNSRDHAEDDGADRGPLGLDVWARASYVRIREDERRVESAFGHLGVDYRFTPGLTVGLMQQIDGSEDDNPGLQATADGWGWLVGPYVVARLPLNLLFDARAALGESYNSVVATSQDRYRFRARRLLIRGQLSADYSWDALRFRPLVRAIYYEEAPHGAGANAGERDGIARLEAGYELSYTMHLENGSTLSPRIAMRGVADGDTESVGTRLVADPDAIDFGTRIEAALRLRSLVGWSLDAGAYYDNIGVFGADTFGGEVTLSVPLN